MRRIITVVILCLALAGGQAAFAHEPEGKRPDRKEWFKQLRCYKHDFLTKELSLTKEQQEKFFPLYDEMDDEIDRINTETRDLERKVDAKTDATDTEVEAAARAVFLQKSAEGQVEEQYFDRFKQILQGRQLLKLRKAEREFTRQLMRQHRRARTPERHNAR